ncbi:PREDICTED: uncharacterized protein LOC109168359 [Ipomoea nil]|uniref:uncharacterized protein LOC109168359 n=1 Tax=Ipomoea nil TaxID=35883 RepID=UPI00090123CB|nr:PREDICTED: uncharacterized protein LOC109168359 [Ipomoea nil]
MDGFNDALNECNLVDMGMSGGRFTWSKGHGTEAWVEERLDRAVATVEWLEIHDDTEVRKVYTSQSDHSAIFVDMEPRPIRHARRSFKFESAWLLDEGCAMVVEAAWGQSRGMEFQHRIELCGQQLQRWGREHSSQFGNRIKIHRNRMAVLKEDRDPQAVKEFLETGAALEVLLRQEEIFWLQRSKQLWLKLGDSNTKYFHKSASARKKRNYLQRLMDQDGV